jgi:hypothetical protein
MSRLVHSGNHRPRIEFPIERRFSLHLSRDALRRFASYHNSRRRRKP